MHSNKIHEAIVEALKRKGIRLTRQRMTVIRILSTDRNHPGVKMILEKARKEVPDISASTVYYTLGLLKKEGLIKELEFYNMENRYESEMTDHIDLICRKCGNIVNFEKDLRETRHAVKESTGFEADTARFEYYGVCAKCRGVKE
ncbi:MAG: Peroxide-responsive repressor PerR [Syntrophorhabdaceae bacterium PtaU1.Bin034]|jgi:Fe2+ or Zn2+ uptake regulation protein|nr:MAG: Peroxide-responsive repressor PerR [Syntrophorhabdaceae bacterium PtaU1.Bin034]